MLVNQQPALAAVDAAFSTRRPVAVPTPKAQQTVADAGTVHQQQKVDRAEAVAAAGLRGPLAADLADAT